MLYKLESRLVLQIATAVGLIGIIFVALLLTGIDTRNIAEEVVDARREVNMQVKRLSGLAELSEEAELAEPRLEVLRNVLPKRDELFSFPDEIAAFASGYGVGLSFSFRGETERNIGYNIVILGDYEEVVSFIEALEENFPFMSIEETSIFLQGEEYNARIKGNVFFQ